MPRIVLIILAAVAAVAGGWGLFWSAAARQTGAVVDAWIENESQFGRIWSCPNREIGGFPLAIRLSCPRLQFQGPVFGRDFSGALAGFDAVASVAQPDRVTLTMAAPFTGHAADGAVDFEIGWRSLEVALAGRPRQLSGLIIDGKDFAAKGAAGSAGSGVAVDPGAFEARANALRVAVSPSAGGEPGAFDFALALSGAEIRPLAAVLGLEAPLDAAISGAASGVAPAEGGSFAATIERWREAGGLVEIKALALSSGATKVNGSGVLALDAAHRLSGKLDVKAQGVSPILRRFGVDPQIIAAGSLVGAFLRGKNGSDDGITLPLRLSDGAVAIGPIRTSLRLQPLY